jgi:lactate dehydrogenase-like 2-hydroxyacid dehydrogenase
MNNYCNVYLHKQTAKKLLKFLQRSTSDSLGKRLGLFFISNVSVGVDQADLEDANQDSVLSQKFLVCINPEHLPATHRCIQNSFLTLTL